MRREDEVDRIEDDGIEKNQMVAALVERHHIPKSFCCNCELCRTAKGISFSMRKKCAENILFS